MKDEDFSDWRRDEPDGDAGAEGASEGGSPGVSGGASAPRHAATPGPSGLSVSEVQCPNCGYNLTGATIGMTCPECGMIVGAGLLHAGGKATSGKAIASMVLGILSIVGCMTYGVASLLLGPLAILFSRLAVRQIKRGEVGGSSSGMATAGLVCGIIGSVIGVLCVVLLASFFTLAISSQPSGQNWQPAQTTPAPAQVPAVPSSVPTDPSAVPAPPVDAPSP